MAAQIRQQGPRPGTLLVTEGSVAADRPHREGPGKGGGDSDRSRLPRRRLHCDGVHYRSLAAQRAVQRIRGFASTSKLQWLLWLVAILFGHVAIWVLRAEQGDYTVLSDIPVDILTVLGFRTGTAAAAKGITAGYVQTGKLAKTGVPTQCHGLESVRVMRACGMDGGGAAVRGDVV